MLHRISKSLRHSQCTRLAAVETVTKGFAYGLAPFECKMNLPQVGPSACYFFLVIDAANIAKITAEWCVTHFYTILTSVHFFDIIFPSLI